MTHLRLTPVLATLLVLAAAGARGQQPPFLIAFCGEYCQPCQQMAPVLKSIEADGVHVEHVDVEAKQQMAQIYKVRVVPTVVCVGQGGKEQGRLTGLQNKQSIMRLLGNASPWKSANHSDQPTWRKYSPPGAVDNGTLLKQVVSRLSPPDKQRMQSQYANDLATLCHEATHKVDERIVHSMGPGYCAFFIGSGQGYCVVFREPRVSTSTVAQYIAPQYRDGLYFKTYIVDLPRQPGYPTSQILDEWTAACNGWQGSREVGASDTGDSTMAQHFCHFADALLVAIQRHDPSYPDLEEMTRFVAWQKSEVAKLAGGVQGSVVAGSHGGNGGYGTETIRPPTHPTGPPPTEPVKPASFEDPRWVKWRADIEVRFTNISQCKCQGCLTQADLDAAIAALRVEMRNEINAAFTQIKIPPAYVPPTPDKQAADIAPYLKHSATLTLLDGTKKTQTKPLNEPLDFTQHSRGVK